MHETDALRIMSALAQPTRLRVVVLLAHAGDSGMASGDIADAVGVPRNLMSSHLAVLGRAGIVASSRTGRAVLYVVDGDALVRIGDHLRELAAEISPVPSRLHPATMRTDPG